MGLVKLADVPSWVTNNIIPKRAIYSIWSGAFSTGTCLNPADPFGILEDRDVLSVYVGSIYDYFGIRAKIPHPTVAKLNDLDGVQIEVRDFFRRLIKCEPRAIMSLYVAADAGISCSSEGSMILQNRDKFLSKMIYSGFGNFAKECFTRMQEEPGKNAWKGEERQAQFHKLGFDARWAAKGLLTLKVGAEILETRNVWVNRARRVGDAGIWKKIKAGSWNLSQVVLFGESLNRLMEKSLEVSALPETPTVMELDDLLIDIITHYTAAESVMRRHEILDRTMRGNE